RRDLRVPHRDRAHPVARVRRVRGHQPLLDHLGRGARLPHHPDHGALGVRDHRPAARPPEGGTVSRSPSRTSAVSRARRSAGRSSSRTPLVVAAGVAAIIVALVLAVTIAGEEDDAGTEAAGTLTTVEVSGNPLPELSGQAPDPAVGMTMPTLRGASQDGEAMTIGPDGPAKIIVYLAHWCPHCQAEVP